MTSASEVMNIDSNQVQQHISQYDDKNLVGAAIFAVCSRLHNDLGDQVPQTKAGLIALDLDEAVASLLMQHVFGSSELVIGLHARKILTALDMLDWEETEIEEKKDVKMAKLPPDRVRKSLKTWLPMGQALEFHDTMDSLGALLAAPPIGYWGRIKSTINTNFAPKDKALLHDMTESISQFYTATKGRKRARC